MKRTSLFTLVVSLLFSCGFVSAAPELHRYAYVTAGYDCSALHSVAHIMATREQALLQWQHEVDRGSVVSRADMHASGAGFVFTAIKAQPLTVETELNT